MSKLGHFFGIKPNVPAVDDDDDNSIELNNELYISIARQLANENESIRDLLIEADQKINELDAIKRAIGQQVEPVSKTLHALEEAKSERDAAEKKIVMLESDGAQLRETLTVAQKKNIALESANAQQTGELAKCRTQITDLKARVQQQSGEIQIAHEENRRLSDRVALADRQTVQLKSEVESTRQKLETTQQKLSTSENERATLQKSLDKALAEMSQISQRLLDTEKAFEDAKQKYESDIALHQMNYEALNTRATLTSKLLEDTRKSMIERAKEIQSSIAA